MGKFSHVVGLVELARIDLVHVSSTNFASRSIVALDKQYAAWQLLEDTASYKRMLCIFQPDISIARKVVLAFDTVQLLGRWLGGVGLDELRCKGVGSVVPHRR